MTRPPMGVAVMPGPCCDASRCGVLQPDNSHAIFAVCAVQPYLRRPKAVRRGTVAPRRSTHMVAPQPACILHRSCGAASCRRHDVMAHQRCTPWCLSLSDPIFYQRMPHSWLMHTTCSMLCLYNNFCC